MKIKIGKNLSGRYRFRTNIFGKLILQVEEYNYTNHGVFYSKDDVVPVSAQYRDAKLTDLDLGE